MIYVGKQPKISCDVHKIYTQFINSAVESNKPSFYLKTVEEMWNYKNVFAKN